MKEKKEKLKNIKVIKVIVWDMDGTLYGPDPQLLVAIKDTQLKILAKTKNKSIDQIKSLYLRMKKKYKSGTIVLNKLGCGSYKSILTITDNVITKEFIQKDPQLLEMFRSLSSFRHLILANKVRVATLRQLKWLGLNPKIFEKIFTIEDFGMTKPSPRPFKMVLDYTKLPAENHLMVGDRLEVDLIPAKKLGMKTCLVWHVKSASWRTTCLPRDTDKRRHFTGWRKSKIADVSIPTVYDIVDILEI